MHSGVKCQVSMWSDPVTIQWGEGETSGAGREGGRRDYLSFLEVFEVRFHTAAVALLQGDFDAKLGEAPLPACHAMAYDVIPKKG